MHELVIQRALPCRQSQSVNQSNNSFKTKIQSIECSIQYIAKRNKINYLHKILITVVAPVVLGVATTLLLLLLLWQLTGTLMSLTVDSAFVVAVTFDNLFFLQCWSYCYLHVENAALCGVFADIPYTAPYYGNSQRNGSVLNSQYSISLSLL